MKDYYCDGLPRILSDLDITRLCDEHQMISPFHRDLVRRHEGQGIISFGLSSYGYDLRASRQARVFSSPKFVNGSSGVIDPKNFDPDVTDLYDQDWVDIPPNGFLLCSSVESLRMPRNVTGVVLGKSTYARCGLVCIATPLEAGWTGQVVLEFSNTTPRPIRFYTGEGCAQVLFHSGHHCLTSYSDRAGKYQGQMGITFPKT